MIDPVTKSSFTTLLRLHEVMQISELVAIFADDGTEIHSVEGQAWFRYGAAESVTLTGRRRAPGRKPARATGKAVQVGVRNQL